MENFISSIGSLRPMLTVIAASVATLIAGQASAMKLDSGSEDVEIRFDNTVKYNAGWRAQNRDSRIGDTWGNQAGDYKFDNGNMVTNRFDLFSEFDLIYKDHYGFRLSGAAWKDKAYDESVTGNPAFQKAGKGTAHPQNKFSSSVSRYYTQSGEILDAFVFGRINFDESPLSLKAGKHALYWGESLFSPIHGVSYAQAPLDLRKGVANAGIEVKELFLPTSQFSAHLQVNPKLSLAFQLPLDWKPNRFYEGGTYFTAADALFQGGTSFLPNGLLGYNGDVETGPNAKPKNRGSFGLMMKAQSETIDGTVGFYARRFDEMSPAVLLNTAVIRNGLPTLDNAYAKGVRLMGVSLAKAIGGVAVGAELVSRQNATLSTKAFSTQIARGDVWTGLVNAVAYIGKTSVFDSAVLLTEGTFTSLAKVNSDSVDLVNSCAKTGSAFGCTTKDSFAISTTFTPTWFQVFPSVDVTLPIHYERGISGNSAIGGGGTKNDGAWSIGLGTEYKGKYKMDLAYHSYFGPLDVVANPNFGSVPGIGPLGIGAGSGTNGALSDRAWVSLTLKTTF